MFAQTQVTIVGHRGASGHAPENTIAAIDEAVRQGADFVEVDVQLTKDGEPVLVHDGTLARTTNAANVFPDADPWRVSDHTLEEIRRLDAGSWFDPVFTGQRVPTLREALDAMRGRIGLWLELKRPRPNDGLEKAVAEVLRGTPGGWLTEPRRCVATSFDNAALTRFAEEIEYAVPFGQLGSTVPDDVALRELAGWVTYYIPDCRAVASGDLVRIRAAGLASAFWTPNDPVTVTTLVAQGAAALIGNYPALVDDVLRGVRAVPDSGLALERLVDAGSGRTGCVAVLRNVGGEPVETEGWQLRGDPADLLWTGPRRSVPAGAGFEIELSVRTDSVALHGPDGTLVDVVGRPV